MSDRKSEKTWISTNTSNLWRHGPSGRYYLRVKVRGQEKWRSLKTTKLSVAKAKMGDVENAIRGQALVTGSGRDSDHQTVGAFIEIFQARTTADPTLKPSTKSRREIALKALAKTWPDLAARDARRVTPTDVQGWAARALREGTGFVAPNAKTVRAGMSASAYNKCVDALRAVFEIAKEHGAAFNNPADSIKRARLTQRRLGESLPSPEQFRSLVQAIAGAGARQSRDCADMVRLLAYSGLRLGEATALRWRHVGDAHVFVPGSKTETSYRKIPLFPQLAELLKELRTRRSEEPAEAPVLRVRECKGALRSACAAVGIPRLTHHDLRHLFATRCVEAGVDFRTLAEWMGHADGGALLMRTYSHVRNEHSAAQAAKVVF